MSFFRDFGADLGMGFLRKPLKNATGMSDAQLAGTAALVVAAPYALPAAGSAGAGSAGASTAGSTGGWLNFAGTQAPAPIADMSVRATPQIAAGVGETGGGGLLSTVGQYAKPATQGMEMYNQAKAMNQQEPVQGGQLPQYQDLSGLLSANNQQMAQLEAKRMARRQQGLLGGVYG